MKTRVAVVEDNAALREGLVLLLDGHPRTLCAGAFASCEELLARLPDLRCDLLLLDVGLPGMSGVEGIRPIKAVRPELVILMLTVYEDEHRIFQAVRDGASGYILKKTPPDRIVEAVLEAADGGAPMTASVARKVIDLFQRSSPRERVGEALTTREMEVLSALVQGMSYKMIAGEYGISIDTVRTHIKSIYEKLHVHSKSEAVASALKNRLF